MPFDLDGARAAGYSEAEIADHLAQTSHFDAGAARSAGYSDDEIIDHLSAAPAKAPTPTPRADARRKDKGVFRHVDAAVRGAADTATFGFADEISAGLDSVPALIPGGESYRDSFDRHVKDERAIDAADKEQVPASRIGGQIGGFVGSLGAGVVADAARLVPRVARGARGLARGAENALRGAAAGAGYGGLSAAGNAEGDAGQRAAAAVPGAAVGGVMGAAAVPVGAAIGAGVRAVANRGAAPMARAANALRGRVDVPAARARVNALRGSGAEPAAIHGMDDAGRGFVAATAKRQTPARDLVQRRADAARVNLPGRVNRQAGRLSADPRNPGQIAEELGAARGAQADAAYGAVRGDVLDMDPRTVSALRTGPGREAISEAASRERDPEVRAALNRLAAAALDDPSTQITVGMAHSISEVLQGRAAAAGRTGDNKLASFLGDLSRDVRQPAASANAGYAAANAGYAQQSRIMEAAEQGEDYLLRNTDEFTANAAGPGEEGNELARATARRAVERRAGESPAGALSTAESIAIAPEQQARTRAILPEHEAQALEGGMQAEVDTYRQTQQVAPRSGSPTNLNTQDQEAAAATAGFVATALGGPKAWGAALLSRLRTAGISDRDAEAVADIATDPARLDELLNRMERMNPGSGRALANIIGQVGAREGGEATQPSVEVSLPSRPELGSGVSYGPAGR